MAITTTVGTTATLIRASSVEQDKVRVRNTGATACEVSTDNTLVTGQGFPMAAGAEAEFELDAGKQLFGIVAAGTTTVAVL
jgi:hypothetical protein